MFWGIDFVIKALSKFNLTVFAFSDFLSVTMFLDEKLRYKNKRTKKLIKF
jgi:hypothetical protein